MLSGVFVPELSNLGDHRILRHCSSSGVHITGNGKPEARTICSMVLRVVALAMWVQFHVTR